MDKSQTHVRPLWIVFGQRFFFLLQVFKRYIGTMTPAKSGRTSTVILALLVALCVLYWVHVYRESVKQAEGDPAHGKRTPGSFPGQLGERLRTRFGLAGAHEREQAAAQRRAQASAARAARASAKAEVEIREAARAAETYKRERDEARAAMKEAAAARADAARAADMAEASSSMNWMNDVTAADRPPLDDNFETHGAPDRDAMRNLMPSKISSNDRVQTALRGGGGGMAAALQKVPEAETNMPTFSKSLGARTGAIQFRDQLQPESTMPVKSHSPGFLVTESHDATLG